MKKLTRKKQLETIFVICLGLTLIAFARKNFYVLSVSFIVGVLGIVFEKAAFGIAFSWFKLGDFLGKISSTVILTLLYFFVLVPTAFIVKLTKKKSNFSAEKSTSYYHIRNHHFSAKDLENTW